MDKKKIIVVIPAYNEQSAIRKVVSEVSHYADLVAVVDDGSRDGTQAEIKKTKAVLLKHHKNLGQGAALRTGFEYSKREHADIVVTFDGDGQFMASDIPAILSPVLRGQAEISLGSRFLGKTIGIPFSKLVTLKLGILFTLLYSGIKLTDTHNGFRAISRRALEDIEITRNRMAHASEIIDQIVKKRINFAEVPVTVTYTNSKEKRGQGIFDSIKIALELLFRK